MSVRTPTESGRRRFVANYFIAAKAEKVFSEYKRLALEYWKAKPAVPADWWMTEGAPHPESKESNALRSKLLQLYPIANTFAKRLGIVVSGESYPAPAVGGPVVPINFLYAVIEPDQGHNYISEQAALDRIEVAISMAKALKEEWLWRQALNPVWYLIEVVAYVLRIPFLILRRAGIPERVEESVWGHAIKVIFFIILVVLSARFGFDLKANDILSFFK